MSDLADLKPRYDVVVIGGGVHGAAAALEAARHGLGVLLVERDDFCSHTSANSLKIIHGGLRYLRSADLRRSRESAREQRALLRLAPHLVKPLPCLMGTDRSLTGGRAAMAAGIWAYDHLVCAGLGARPRGRTMTVEEADRLAGFGAFDGCTGAALWHDAQVTDSERLVITYLKTAERAGASLRNYTEATGVDRGESVSVTLRSIDDPGTHRIEAGRVVDTASLLDPHPFWTRAVNLVINRRFGTHAIGRKLSRRSGDSQRLFFATPSGGRLIVGTWYFPDRRDDWDRLTPDELRRCETDVQDLLPDLAIDASEISRIHIGRLPVSDAAHPLSLLEKPVIRAHEGDSRVVCVTGVKYTTARPTAAKALAETGLDVVRPGDDESRGTLYGAGPPAGESLEATVRDLLQEVLDKERLEPIVRRLSGQYGAAAVEIARMATRTPNGIERIPGCDAIRAEIAYCIEQEYCRTTGDFLLRRSGLASLGPPPDDTIGYCVAAMAEYLGWSDSRIADEEAATNALLQKTGN